jgi:transcriptional regulator with XRE-family HTH domain
MEKYILGGRLRQERTRLGMTQEAFAAIGGVRKLSQISYEQDKTLPDAGYLIALAAIGVDVQYVMFGKPSIEVLADDENELLIGYRKLDIRGKAGVLGTVAGLNSPTENISSVIKGNANHVVQGNQTIKAPLKLNINTTKKKP